MYYKIYYIIFVFLLIIIVLIIQYYIIVYSINEPFINSKNNKTINKKKQITNKICPKALYTNISGYNFTPNCINGILINEINNYNIKPSIECINKYNI